MELIHLDILFSSCIVQFLALIELKRENAGIPEDGILRVSDELTFDMFKGVLRANSTGKAVHLAGKSLGLLLLLASRPGEVVTYDSIIDYAWGDRDALGKDSSDKDRLWVMASRLRDKIDSLELDFDPIVCYKKVGYSFSTKPRNTD